MSNSKIFMLAYASFSVAGFLPFYASRNVAFKRRYYPAYVVIAFALLLGAIASEGGLGGSVIAALACAGMGYLVFKNTSFCDCGHTVWGQVFLWRQNCPVCDATLPEGRMQEQNGKWPP